MISNHFSALSRNELLTKVDNDYFDLLVVGGGITGAGIALDAVCRGLKVILVEKEDFSWGTSSRSTKLIHGGLRYLKQMEVGLVREVGKERAIVHRIARHIVLPEKMLLPIIEGGSLGKRMSSFGLWIYDKLAGVEKEEQRKMLSKKKTLKAEPLLRKDILQGGGLYYEYRTDDARLTIEIMKTAVGQGAICLNYAEAEKFLYDDKGAVQGAVVKDRIDGKLVTIQARKIVNAAGPWVDKVRKLDQVKISGKRLHLTKGVHVVVNYHKLPVQQSVYFDVMDDGRMVFAIPREGITYIGTTDTNYTKEIDAPEADGNDVNYILKAANTIFPGVNIKPADVISTWSGLRPLIHEDGKDPSELSRKDEVFVSDSGLISIAGGKLTGYRKMAERIVDKVANDLKESSENYKHLKSCKTHKIKVSGAKFDTNEEMRAFLAALVNQAESYKVEESHIANLFWKYGTNAVSILEKNLDYLSEGMEPEDSIRLAEVWYGVNFEMVTNLNDYLIRRTGRLYFERDKLEKMYPKIAEDLAKLLGLSEDQQKAQITAFEKAYKAVLKWQK
ncbi:MAG: glycerol-3-phosphate dehydrogenase/oxidase [Bacteroidota bacterium]